MKKRIMVYFALLGAVVLFAQTTLKKEPLPQIWYADSDTLKIDQKQGLYSLRWSLGGTNKFYVDSTGKGYFAGDLLLATGADFTIGSMKWNSGTTDSIDGEQIGANTIDDDAIDFADVTSADLTFNSNIIPSATGTYDLGSTTVRFDSVFFDDMKVYANASITGNLTVTGTTTSTGYYYGNQLYAAPAGDSSFSGQVVQYTAGEVLTIGTVVYLKTDGKVWKADADQSTTMPPLGVVYRYTAANGTATVVTGGYYRNNAWNWSAVGKWLYVSTTDGTLTETVPSGNGDYVYIIGIAHDGDTVFIMPFAIVKVVV